MKKLQNPKDLSQVFNALKRSGETVTVTHHRSKSHLKAVDARQTKISQLDLSSTGD